MPDPYVVRPDSAFIGRILAEGGEDAKKCFQCATCSVVCELSEGSRIFPRKEMIWTQWGLKDRLLVDPDVWLCHQCNDCSTHCPRGARPGDVMAAIRRESMLQYAFPGFLARWLNQPKYVPFLLLIPALLLGLAYLSRDSIQNALGISTNTGARIVYSFSSMLPQWLLISFFLFFSVFVLLAVAVGVVRFWRAMKAADARDGITTPAKGLLASIGSTLKSIVTHDKFTKCKTDSSRYVSHSLAFFGFIALFVVSLWVMTASINPLIGDGFAYPFSFWNPWRLLANLGGVALAVACALMIRERLKKTEEGGSNTFFDWAFLWALLAVVVTGFIAEAMHYTRIVPQRHIAYFIHLVFVFSLLMYLPYSKFAHLIYRTTAMVYVEHAGLNGGPAAVAAADPQQEKVVAAEEQQGEAEEQQGEPEEQQGEPEDTNEAH